MSRHESTPNDTSRRWLKALGAGAVTAGALDAAWIGGAALKLYESKIPHLMGDTVNAAPAAAFYVLHLAGTVHLAVRPTEERTTGQRVRDGAVLGALAWGTFGLTNAAVLDEFPVGLALTDTAWGAFLTATTAGVAGLVMGKRRRKGRKG